MTTPQQHRKATAVAGRLDLDSPHFTAMRRVQPGDLTAHGLYGGRRCGLSGDGNVHHLLTKEVHMRTPERRWQANSVQNEGGFGRWRGTAIDCTHHKSERARLAELRDTTRSMAAGRA